MFRANTKENLLLVSSVSVYSLVHVVFDCFCLLVKGKIREDCYSVAACRHS